MRTIRSLVLLPLITFSLAHADIREIQQMNQILPEVNNQVLLVFDIDNTIAEPAQSLGSDQWYDHLVKEKTAEYLKQGLKAEQAESKAIDTALKMWEQVQRVTKAALVEKVTATIIENAQSQGIPVMALTARPTTLAAATLAQLKSIGVRMDRNPPVAGKMEFTEAHPALFTEGVAFVGPKNNKGKSLAVFLKKTGLAPKKVVFVDDKVKHVNSVDAVMKTLDIPCTA